MNILRRLVKDNISTNLIKLDKTFSERELEDYTDDIMAVIPPEAIKEDYLEEDKSCGTCIRWGSQPPNYNYGNCHWKPEEGFSSALCIVPTDWTAMSATDGENCPQYKGRD